MQDEDEPAGRLRADIRARRLTAGLSQRDLADRVGYSRGYVCKVESGATFPPERLIEAIDRELNAGGRLTELRERAWRHRQADRIGLPRQRDEEVATDRRDLFRLGGFALAAAGAAGAADISRRISTGGADPGPLGVDELETRAAGIAAHYPTTPHAVLANDAAALWSRAEAALDSRLPMRVRARIVQVAGQLAYYVGRCAFNLGDDGTAVPFAALAAQHAEDVGDPAMVASSAALRSSVAYWQGRYPAALEYLGEVHQAAPSHLAARVAAYEARTYAAMGNGPAAFVACDRMQATAGDFPSQPGSTPIGEAGAALFRAAVAVRVGDPHQGERWARRAIAAYQPGTAEYTPEEARHAHLTLAAAVLARDRPDAEEAAEVTRRVVDGLVLSPSRTVSEKARRMWGSFTPDQRRLPAVAALGVELAQLPRALSAGTSA
ncbi:MAG: helix-turn-helix domain-containing protein [Frankia sp.]